MKKMIVIVLLIVLVMGLLAACGGNDFGRVNVLDRLVMTVIPTPVSAEGIFSIPTAEPAAAEPALGPGGANEP